MKKIIFLALVILACSATTSFADNFLDNAGFEDPLAAPTWVEMNEKTGAKIDRVSGGMDLSYAAKMWSLNNTTATTMNLRQYFDVTPGTTYYASAYLKSLFTEPLNNNYYAWVEITWRDDTGGGRGTQYNALSPYLKSANDDWQFFQASGIAPDWAVDASISLKFVAPINSGTLHSVYIDNTWAGTTAAPEPISSVLFIIGGVSLAALRKKRII